MSSSEPWHQISACSAFFLYQIPLVAGNATTVLVITGLNVWAKQVRFNNKSWHELLDCHCFYHLVTYWKGLIFLNFYFLLRLIMTPHVFYVHMTYVYSFSYVFHFT